MIAEIHHKPVNCHSEDQLTGNIFGSLRYLPYDLFLKIFLRCVEPMEVKNALLKSMPPVCRNEWGRGVKFWPQYGSSAPEPDVVLTLNDMVIMFEAKYQSGESGDDQIKRQAELLLNSFDTVKNKFLVIIAPADIAKKIFYMRREMIINSFSEVKFGYITWQRLFDSLQNHSNTNIICSDITDLLLEKGFGGFRGFNMMNKKTMDSFRIVRESHETVKNFIGKCFELAESKKEFTVAPTKTRFRILRWNTNEDYRGWSYLSLITVFQCMKDRRLPQSEWRNGSLYVLQVSFNYNLYQEPTACIAKYDYESMSGWDDLSVGDHWKFYEPLYEQMNFEHIGRKYYAFSETPLARYNGLTQITGIVIPLSEITEDNIYEKVFDEFMKLRTVENPKVWLKQKA